MKKALHHAITGFLAGVVVGMIVRAKPEAANGHAPAPINDRMSQDILHRVSNTHGLRPTMRKLFAVIAGLASLCSGLAWQFSAHSTVLAGQAPKATPGQRAISTFLHTNVDDANMLAAWCAVIAGMALALSLFFDD